MPKMYITILPVLVFYMTLNVAGGCSFVPGKEPPRYSMSETLGLAPIVVSGKDLYSTDYSDSERINITFQVSCVYKASLEIPRVIFLLDVGETSCHGTRMEDGNSYIVGLQVASGDTITRGDADLSYTGQGSDKTLYYTVFEPDDTNTGAFEINAENLNLTASLCGMNNTIVNLGTGDSDDHECPVRTVTSETCVQASGAAQLMSSQLRLWPLNSKGMGVLMSMVLCALVSLLLVL